MTDPGRRASRASGRDEFPPGGGATAAQDTGAVLLVSTADWDNPFWTNKQHVAVELARQGREVLYVESAGLRRPAMQGRDLARIQRRLRRAFQPARRVAAGLWVLSPPTAPWQGVAALRALNRVLLTWSLKRAERRTGLRPEVLLTYSPLTSRLIDLRHYAKVAYHCVDDVAAQPGMPVQLLREAEAELLRRADIVFATAPILAAKARAVGARQVRLLPNVCDADHFGRALSQDVALPADLAQINEPRIGFVGAVSGYKLDFALLRATAIARPDYSFVLIGEIGEGDPWSDTSPLRGLANLHLLGPRPYGELPAYLSGFQVAILPSAANAYTEAMFPMKFFEYLSAGRLVVTTPLPALAPYAHLAFVAPPEAWRFAAAIDHALAGDGAPLEERLAVARRHTYTWRTREMLAALDGLPGAQAASST